MNGNGLVYQFKTGDTTFTANFAVTKQNFTVRGSNGTMNTIAKDIFANNMVMTSVQGDIINSKTGQGSFEKKEFRFERIRTSGLYVPNVALYQAKLHPACVRQNQRKCQVLRSKS